MIVSEPHLSFHCFLCGKQFDRQGGPKGGMFVGRYVLEACNGCYGLNSGGWAPQFEARLIAHLTANGLPTPDRNAQGLLPRD
jgi:hypothetical protein